MQIHGFPNCFIMSANQGGFTANFPHLLDEVATHLSYIVGHALKNGFRTVEASERAEQDWVNTILEKGTGAMGGLGGPGCTPGYYNNEGRPSPGAAQGAPYGGGSIQFFKLLEEWRAEGTFEGVEFDA